MAVKTDGDRILLTTSEVKNAFQDGIFNVGEHLSLRDANAGSTVAGFVRSWGSLFVEVDTGS